MIASPPDPRDLIGYGRDPQRLRQVRLCVQFVINYEEGGEHSILHGDAASEAFLSEIVGAQPRPGQRHMTIESIHNMESIYEFGSHTGFWRLWRMFIVGAMARHADAVAAMIQSGWEIATHGLKWIDYKDFTYAEQKHVAEAIRIHSELTGVRPLGLYQGRSSVHTLDIAIADQDFLYTGYSYWVEGPHSHHLIVPYTSLDANDSPQGFNTGEQFFTDLKDSFDQLYSDGETAPKIMSVGLHCRLTGPPDRAAALARLLDYVQGHKDVWVARRLDIARHWIEHHPPVGGYRPSRMPRALFVDVFGDVDDHTPQIAEAVHRAELRAVNDTATGLHSALAMQKFPDPGKLTLIRAHPDFAGRLSRASMGMTADSTKEQASAGLDRLTPRQLARFTELNAAYASKFDFPFIIAVKGLDKTAILAAFETRVAHDREAEFATALREIDCIALLRLQERLPS